MPSTWDESRTLRKRSGASISWSVPGSRLLWRRPLRPEDGTRRLALGTTDYHERGYSEAGANPARPRHCNGTSGIRARPSTQNATGQPGRRVESRSQETSPFVPPHNPRGRAGGVPTELVVHRPFLESKKDGRSYFPTANPCASSQCSESLVAVHYPDRLSADGSSGGTAERDGRCG